MHVITISPPGATIPQVSHHLATVGDTTLHHVRAGTAGSPVVLVHGFPESWWVFHRLIPLLAQQHRVFAVDLRGFGDSAVAGDDFDSATAAEDLHRWIDGLGVGPVHLAAQDVSGATAYRVASNHPEVVRSLIGTEMGLAGFGLEGFADVTRGGSWHIGVLAAPGVADLLLTGRERELVGGWALPSMTAVPGSFDDRDVTELARGYARPGGWNGAAGLYRSLLTEGRELRSRAQAPLDLPALAIDGSGGPFTAATLRQVVGGPLSEVELEGVGHHVALEAPERAAAAVLEFLARVDR